MKVFEIMNICKSISSTANLIKTFYWSIDAIEDFEPGHYASMIEAVKGIERAAEILKLSLENTLEELRKEAKENDELQS